MKKKWLKWVGILLVVLIVIVIIIACRILGVFEAGNASKYDLKNVEVAKTSPLKDKKIVFLGSSVTKGAASLGTSFVDYLEKIDQMKPIKEAKSGTTLVDEGSDSYVQRLQNNVKETSIDALVVQLSTNDATREKPLGKISSSKQKKDFDTTTIIGAMEYIIAYAQETWKCPVIFYTGTYFENETYTKMVDSLYELQGKWGIEIIDLWNDKEMRTIDKDVYDRYMKDEIHPTKQGYLEWWTPNIQTRLYEIFSK